MPAVAACFGVGERCFSSHWFMLTAARAAYKRPYGKYGLAGYEIAHQALEMRATMERLFMLGLFGDMLGVPILPPYYGLRLLPFVVPQIVPWKRRMLREKDVADAMF